MIEPIHALILAFVQGLTEFFPISSSAHLVIPSLVFGWPDQGLAFDVAVHLGTLLAVMLFYRRDLQQMLLACLQPSASGDAIEQRRLVFLLFVGTLPAVIFGFFGADFIEAELRSLPVIASSTLGFGLLLALADRRAVPAGEGLKLSLMIALWVGLAQACALIPGASRSGVTITAALLLGLSRHDAARFSFLLSIPVIAGAGLLKSIDLLQSDLMVDWGLLATAALVAGITAYACISLFIRLLEQLGLMPFVYYRIVLALILYYLWLA